MSAKTKKCPNCGATIQSFTTICPECGYAIEDNKSNETVQEFTKQINELLEKAIKTNDDRALNNYISGFSIPNNKADLLEFASVLKTMRENELGYDAFNKKYKECITKIRTLFPDDPTFTSFLKNIQIEKEETHAEEKEDTKKFWKGVGSLFILPVLGLLAVVLFGGDSPKKVPEACVKKVGELVAKNKPDKAEKYLYEFSQGVIPELKDAYSAVVTSYVEKGEISRAQKICDRWLGVSNRANTKAVVMPLYNYFISEGLYEEAEPYIPDMAYYDSYYKYLKDCVEKMCQKGNIEDAKRFARRKAIYYKDKNYPSDFSEKAVLSRLNQIIDSY